MSQKTIFVIIGVLAALGAFLWWKNRQKDEKDKTASGGAPGSPKFDAIGNAVGSAVAGATAPTAAWTPPPAASVASAASIAWGASLMQKLGFDPSVKIDINKILTKGNRGNEVLALQKAINYNKPSKPVAEDGVFGNETFNYLNSKGLTAPMSLKGYAQKLLFS